MNKTVKIIGLGLAALLLFQYLKKKKTETSSSISEIEEKSELSIEQAIDQIRVNLLDYIESRNENEGKQKSREDIDHDIMIITDVKM